MGKVVCFLIVLWSWIAHATNYYVSSSTGNDSNSGTASSTAWQTIAHVNAQTFQPGDSILFRRGDLWNESLVPPSSGTSGNPIAFDAYGAGPAPNLTGYYAVPSSAWVLVTGNAWKAPLPANYSAVNFCLFGSLWGQKVAASSSNLTAQWDFYLANGFLYVYSVGNPASYYNSPIVPMALSNTPVININGKSWLTFQHFLIDWFDQYGVYVQGASDHLVFANMEADSMIPQGTQPLGFYVNESAPGPGDIKIYNSEAHLNYDGFRFDGAATAITMVNDKAYANRDGALVDNTGAVTYSYCHFYASSLAVANSTDVLPTPGGPTAGPGNIPQDTPPAVQVWQRYPAQVTLTVDDAGMTPGADTYYANTVLPIADAAGVPVGAAITVGYPLAQTLIPTFQSWISAGRDVTSHSVSHTYYTNTDALDLQYVGAGTAATLSISNKTLTITVTGASDSVTYNLAQGQPQGTIVGLQQALNATGKFTTSYLTPCQGPYGTGCAAYTAQALLSQDLADVSGQDVKNAVYHLQLDVMRLTTDEITLSRQWMTTNLTGLPATPVYVYPGGYETPTMQGIAAGVPYNGARGALKEDLGVKDTYASGFDVQNITSFGVNPTWQGLQPAVLNQKIQALVWKQMVWGVPWGIFWHWNAATSTGELSATEITNLIQDFKSSGATIQTNTSLVNWLLMGTLETGTDGNFYYKFPATVTVGQTGGLDFRPTKNSPVVDAGQNLGAAYAIDINGVNQNSYGSGWEIGAHVYMGYAAYGGGTGSGHTVIGEAPSGPPNYPAARRSSGNELNVDQLFMPKGNTASTYCPSLNPPLTASPTAGGGCLPNFGGATGAGTILTNPVTGMRDVRLTDNVTDPNATGVNYVNILGNGEFVNTWSCDDKYVMVGRSGASGNYVMQFSPTQFGPLFYTPSGVSYSTALLYAGSGSNKAEMFNASMFTRNCASTPDLFYYMDSTNTIVYSVNLATDLSNAHTAGSTATTTTVTNFADPANACFGNSAANHRYSCSAATCGTAIPFNPQFVDPIQGSDGDVSIGTMFSNVYNGCWDPKHGVIDWQPSTSYSASAHTCGNVTVCGSLVTGATGAVITPMDGVANPGGHSYRATTTGISATSAPSSWCQTPNCAQTDGTVGWTEIGVQNNWGSNGTGHLANSCSLQDTGTLVGVYHPVSGSGFSAGDCDVLDMGNDHAYHNGTDLGQVTQGGIISGGPFLFSLHGGGPILGPTEAELSISGCIGTPGNLGASCTFNTSQAVFWPINTTNLYYAGSIGHHATGHASAWGTPGFPVMEQSDFQGNITHYMAPYGTSNPGCTPITCFANGSYPIAPAEHMAWACNGSGSACLSDANSVNVPFITGNYNPSAGYNGFDKPFVDPLLGELDVWLPGGNSGGGYDFPIREQQTFSFEGSDFGPRYHTFNWSQSGHYACWTSNAMNTLARSGNNCGTYWQPNTSYANGTVIVPMAGNPPPNDNVSSYTFQQVSGSTCTSGTTAPTWNTWGSTPSSNLTDNTCTWAPNGPNSCGYDVFCGELK
jgi:hypothetical protein